MDIPIFSFLHIVVICAIVLYSPNFKKIYLNNVTLLFFLEIINSQGYFIQLDNKEYEFHIVQLYIVFSLSLVFLVSNLKGKRRLVYSVFMFLFATLLSILNQGIFPYDGYILPTELFSSDCSWDVYVTGKSVLYKYNFDLIQNITSYRRICMYALVIYIMKVNIKLLDVYNIIENLLLGSFFIVLYGYFEMLLKNVLNMPMEAYKFNEVLLGVSHSTYTWESASVLVDGSYRLQGFTREPSHYVFSLLIFATLILIAIRYHKLVNIITPQWYYIELAMILILMPMTGGMSAIWCIFSLLISYIFMDVKCNFNFSKILKWVFGFLAGIGMFFLLMGDSLLMERFLLALETVSFLISAPNILLSAGMDGSTLARFTGIIVCFGNWLDNPLLGLGYGITKAYDFTMTMLVGNGVIGCGAWYHFITTSGNGCKKYDHLLLLIIFCIEFLPTGSVGSWYTFSYIFLLAEATALYRSSEIL